jgi:heme oxygenase (biliverdin-IX-beta and delta-forming)
MPSSAVVSERKGMTAISRVVASGLRPRLREATAPAHAQLDARLGALDLRTLADYRQFLQTIAAALLPLEEALVVAGAPDIVPDWDARSRRHAILEDLVVVGGSPLPLAFPVRLGLDGALGVMYVLEGSRLGAIYLLDIVSQSGDPRVCNASSYLRHGAGQRLWQSFLAILEHQGASLGDDRGVINGAHLAFDLFLQAVGRIGSVAADRRLQAVAG